MLKLAAMVDRAAGPSRQYAALHRWRKSLSAHRPSSLLNERLQSEAEEQPGLAWFLWLTSR